MTQTGNRNSWPMLLLESNIRSKVTCTNHLMCKTVDDATYEAATIHSSPHKSFLQNGEQYYFGSYILYLETKHGFVHLAPKQRTVMLLWCQEAARHACPCDDGSCEPPQNIINPNLLSPLVSLPPRPHGDRMGLTSQRRQAWLPRLCYHPRQRADNAFLHSLAVLGSLSFGSCTRPCTNHLDLFSVVPS